MLPSLIALLDRAYARLGRAWVITVFGNLVIVFLIVFSSMGAQPDASDPTVFDLQLAFSADRFVEVVEAWGPDVTNDFRAHLWIDCLFPVVYSVALASMLALLSVRDLKTRPGDQPPYWVLVMFALPFVGALCDLVENVLHWIALDDPLNPPGVLIVLASGAAAIKWTVLGIALAVIVMLFVWRAVAWWRATRGATA